MSTRSHTVIALVAGAVFGFSAALTNGVLAEKSSSSTRSTDGSSALPWEEARLFAEVYERIKHEYVDDVDDHALMEKAIRGMVAALDPHSAYLDSDEFEEIRLSTMGSYPGVGIEVVAEDSGVKILRPIDGSPAQVAGLQPGDLIVKIDGDDIGADLAGAIAKMRGSAGSLVRLTVRRPLTGELVDYSLRRAKVEVHSVVEQTLEPGYGYVRVTTFSETTADDLGRAIARLKRSNPAGIKGLVLDLRNNPGGVLEAGVAVADAFLNDGVIVTADGRTADARFEMDATPGDLIDGASLIVLVNGGTASASEIVAGALKDHGRAQLLGHKTYGKGSVQTVMPLAHGGAVKLTTSRYFTPSGASIHGKGIIPDIVPTGAEEPPVELAVKSSQSLETRDSEIRLAVDTLKAHAVPVRTQIAATVARASVP
ncbi:MAG TPA: S41 family peptidase [Steroidobacteraceae bacterium]|jgi:carboxyl-terminal processing protease